VSKSYDLPDLTVHHKIIVGEGESDFKFFKAFCAANGIMKFAHAFTGMHSPKYEPSGFDHFKAYLPVLEGLADFDKLTDIVLVCDSAESPDGQFKDLCRQIVDVNNGLGRTLYTSPRLRNVVSNNGTPRVHIMTIPHNGNGGIETLCVDVARDHLDANGHNGTEIEGWVNKFANDACVRWSTEKRDKLRLQAFLSAAWKKKPDVHFSQIFDLTKDRYIPLAGRSFDEIRDFLRGVEAL
jgi:hypothetical protein